MIGFVKKGLRISFSASLEVVGMTLRRSFGIYAPEFPISEKLTTPAPTYISISSYYCCMK